LSQIEILQHGKGLPDTGLVSLEDTL
jgi:hypothetical protein